MPDQNAALAAILKTIQENVAAALKIIENTVGAPQLELPIAGTPHHRASIPVPVQPAGGVVVEGTFDGMGMVGPDGKMYPIPPNYASKSKLVEGDVLKLTITPTGAFIFKQISPVERDRRIGTLVHELPMDEYSVVVSDKKYRILKASATYFRGSDGDETIVLVPKHGSAKWAAVENIVRNRNGFTPQHTR